MSKLRQGDILLFSTPDGGEIQVINGEPDMDGGFESAVYISIFGGDGESHWIEEYQKENEKFKCEFYNFIKGNIKSINNLNKGIKFLERDLAWIKSDTIADKINISIDDLDTKRIRVNVEILANGKKLFENKYIINWGYQKDFPGNERII